MKLLHANVFSWYQLQQVSYWCIEQNWSWVLIIKLCMLLITLKDAQVVSEFLQLFYGLQFNFLVFFMLKLISCQAPTLRLNTWFSNEGPLYASPFGDVVAVFQTHYHSGTICCHQGDHCKGHDSFSGQSYSCYAFLRWARLNPVVDLVQIEGWYKLTL